MEPERPDRYHYVEPGTPPSIRDAISMVASAVARDSRDLTNCLDMACRWSQVLTAMDIVNIQLGRQGLGDQGGYLEPDATGTSDHHWLAVGQGLHLFDPTAGQFTAPVEVGRYFVADGTGFLRWRAQQLGQG
jgi:hypothetical protein